MDDDISLTSQIERLMQEATRLKEHIKSKNDELMRLAEIINRLQTRAEWCARGFSSLL